MKILNETFEDKEFERLIEAKNKAQEGVKEKLTWRKFLLSLIGKEDTKCPVPQENKEKGGQEPV